MKDNKLYQYDLDLCTDSEYFRFATEGTPKLPKLCITIGNVMVSNFICLFKTIAFILSISFLAFISIYSVNGKH